MAWVKRKAKEKWIHLLQQGNENTSVWWMPQRKQWLSHASKWRNERRNYQRVTSDIIRFDLLPLNLTVCQHYSCWRTGRLFQRNIGGSARFLFFLFFYKYLSHIPHLPANVLRAIKTSKELLLNRNAVFLCIDLTENAWFGWAAAPHNWTNL